MTLHFIVLQKDIAVNDTPEAENATIVQPLTNEPEQADSQKDTERSENKDAHPTDLSVQQIYRHNHIIQAWMTLKSTGTL